MTQLPAHIQARRQRNLVADASAGLGALLPPHISIQGNSFTLIDAGGSEQSIGATMDAIIVDVSKVNCKKYFAKAWDPGSADPPDCWSANGVAPSRDAVSPQAPTCAQCPHNVRGSKISAISGAAIKACRDEKWLALLLPSMPSMLFQLVLTPGSFDNWKAYLKKCESFGLVDTSLLVTRFGFQAKTNGVLTFDAPGYTPQELFAVIDKALAEKATDALVGRNDVPRDPALLAPAPTAALPAPAASLPQQAPPAFVPAAAPQAATQGSTSFAPPSAPSFPATPTPPAGTAPGASPSEPQQGRRRRRTAAEMAAANGPAPAAPAAAPQAPVAAPFMPQAAPAAPQPNGPAPSFGMQAGAAPNPEMLSAINSVFGQGTA